MELRAAGRFQRRNFALAAAAAEAFLGPPARQRAVARRGRARPRPRPARRGRRAPADAPRRRPQPLRRRALAEALPEVARRAPAAGGRAQRCSRTRTPPACCASCCRRSTAWSSRAPRTRARCRRPRSRRLAAKLGGPPVRDRGATPRRAGARTRRWRAPRCGGRDGSIYLIADLVRERSATRAPRLSRHSGRRALPGAGQRAAGQRGLRRWSMNGGPSRPRVTRRAAR